MLCLSLSRALTFVSAKINQAFLYRCTRMCLQISLVVHLNYVRLIVHLSCWCVSFTCSIHRFSASFQSHIANPMVEPIVGGIIMKNDEYPHHPKAPASHTAVSPPVASPWPLRPLGTARCDRGAVSASTSGRPAAPRRSHGPPPSAPKCLWPSRPASQIDKSGGCGRFSKGVNCSSKKM